MTIFVALDPVDGFALTDAALIVGINATAPGLRRAGFGVGTYINNRLRDIDETDSDVWDPDCAPGWYWTDANGVQERAPLTNAQQVAQDIGDFKDAVEREALDWERVLAEEAFSPHTDSGHAWSDDLLHALLKPNIRGIQQLLAAAKRQPNNNNLAAYRLRLASFIAIARDPGVRGIYASAEKSAWRPHRAGTTAYGYDVSTGGIRTYDDDDDPDTDEVAVAYPVSYPDGFTVVTWDALAAVRGL